MIGRRIGSWVLQRELGRGGMGAVFEAQHVSLRSRAAVKVLSPGLETEESFRQRFHREADLQAQLRHSNVARVLDYLEDGGQWFLIVEYLGNGSLSDLISRGERISREQAVLWAQQALAGLGHAHQNGIVHRDVKPANLMLNAAGEIVVVDFGIARHEGTPALTATGVCVGTPQYMSPEQIVAPDKVDWRTDIYSLGVVLYELLAGRRPFDSDSQFAVLHAHVSLPPPPLRALQPDIPPALEAVVLRALAKKPDDRYPDCAAMARELEHPAPQPARTATTHVLPPPGPPMGGAIHAASLYQPAGAQNVGSPSSDDVRRRKRRVFQGSLLACTVATVLVASLVAFNLSSADPSPVAKVATSVTTNGSATKTDRSPKGEITVSAPASSPVSPVPAGQSRHTTTPTQTSGSFPSSPQTSPFQTVPSEPLPLTPSQTSPLTPPPASTPVTDTRAAIPAAVLPARPRIAVVGRGSDPLLAGAVEQEMERRLSGYDVSDELGDPEVQELLDRKGANVSFRELGAQLLKSGFQILVMVNVEEAESRTLQLAGIAGHIRASRMRLNAYLLPANRTLGSGWTETVEYTEASAATKAKQSFIGPTADLRSAIDAGWAQLRAGGR